MEPIPFGLPTRSPSRCNWPCRNWRMGLIHMGHLSQALWWAGNLMLACILWRAWRGKFLARYPYFYGYVSCIFCASLLRSYLWAVFPHAYRPGYWISEAISVVAGFGVT